MRTMSYNQALEKGLDPMTFRADQIGSLDAGDHDCVIQAFVWSKRKASLTALVELEGGVKVAVIAMQRSYRLGGRYSGLFQFWREGADGAVPAVLNIRLGPRGGRTPTLRLREQAKFSQVVTASAIDAAIREELNEQGLDFREDFCAEITVAGSALHAEAWDGSRVAEEFSDRQAFGPMDADIPLYSRWLTRDGFDRLIELWATWNASQGSFLYRGRVFAGDRVTEDAGEGSFAWMTSDDLEQVVGQMVRKSVGALS